MGASVSELTALGIVYTSTENLKMFVARITTMGAPQRSEGVESLHVIAENEIEPLVADGSICDGPTISLIVRARVYGLL